MSQTILGNLGPTIIGIENQIARGSGQNDAYPLTFQETVFNNVPVGTGARLPGASPVKLRIVNIGLNALNIYPGDGDIITGYTANLPISVPANSVLDISCFDTSLMPQPRIWYSSSSPLSGVGGGISSIITAGGLTANGTPGGTLAANGTIGLETLAATSLFGNPGTVAGTMAAVAVGANLTLSTAGTLSASAGAGVGTITAGDNISVTNPTGPNATVAIGTIAATSLFGNAGTVAGTVAAVAIGANLSLSAAGTLSATAGSGVGTITAGDNISVTNPNGPNATVAVGTIAASSLFGNAGTVAGTMAAVAIGTNLTLSAAGTLSASASGGSGIATLVASGITSTATSTAINMGGINAGIPTLGLWLNQTHNETSTLYTNGPLVLNAPTLITGSNNVVANYKSLAAGAFTLVANVGVIGVVNANGPTAGLMLTDGTKLATFEASLLRGGGSIHNTISWSATNTFASAFFSSLTTVPTDHIWQRIIFNGTSTYTFDVSVDNFVFLNVGTTSSIGFVPTGVGMSVNSYTAGTGPTYCEIYNWSGV